MYTAQHICECQSATSANYAIQNNKIYDLPDNGNVLYNYYACMKKKITWHVHVHVAHSNKPLALVVLGFRVIVKCNDNIHYPIAKQSRFMIKLIMCTIIPGNNNRWKGKGRAYMYMYVLFQEFNYTLVINLQCTWHFVCTVVHIKFSRWISWIDIYKALIKSI